MPTHKFKVGQRVTVASSGYSRTRSNTFEVVRKLPEERGVFQYRIRSATDGHERVVQESELT
jgi:hypothetical protein